MRMTNINRLMQRLPENIDCAVITSEVNRRYLTGLKSSAGTLLCFKDKAYFIIDFRYIEKAREIVKGCDVILQDRLYSQMAELFNKHKIKTVAVETEKVTISELSTFKRLFSDVDFIETDELSYAINEMRIVKTADEIEKITKAQEISEDAFLNILDYIKPGVSEKEIAMQLEWDMLKAGAEGISFDTIALTGKNTSMPHGVPSDDCIVKNGDFVLMDFGAVVDGYHADMTRTVCVGVPTDEMADVYNIVLTAQKAALSAVKANKMGAKLDAAARDIIKEHGYGDMFGHSLGHGVGLDIHEKPNASENSRMVLKENMLITIEPGIYLEGKFGVRIEDLVVITKENCINLNKTDKNLICL